jgi:FkbM family methyltransferase
MLSETIKNENNVFCFNLAAGDKNGTAELVDFGAFYSSCNSFKAGRVTESIRQKYKPIKVKVKMVRIDDFCGALKIKPDVIKIDAEDFEFEIILGMKRMISKYTPILIIEIGDVPGVDNSTRRIIKLLKKYGYKAWEYENNRLVEHKVKDNYDYVYSNLLFKKI